MDGSTPGHISCRFCGRVHCAVDLRIGERALCLDCGSTLSRHSFAARAPLAFAATSLILLIPALELPLVVVSKFGIDHPSYLWSSTRALWEGRMPVLAIWVALCGLLVPAVQVTTLIVMAIPAEVGGEISAAPFWDRLARALRHWSIAEVQVLAVLVAFIKIGALVHVEIGAGLWFYGAMAVMTLLASRQADYSAIL